MHSDGGRIARMATLRGTRVAILEARMGTELASLVERGSGVPYWVPVVREVERDRRDEVAGAITWLGVGERRLVVLLNGTSVERLFGVAGELGREEELRAGLARAEVVCRGPKPLAALKKRGLAATVRVDEPYTTREVIRALDGLPATLEALVLHHGERSEAIVLALSRRRVRVRELSLYEWELPEDLAPMSRLIDEIIERRVGVVAFTTQIQARHLVAVADRLRKKNDLLHALRTHTLVAAIGPTCADVVRALGIPAHIVPANPKMGPLVQSIAHFLEERASQRPGPESHPPVSSRPAHRPNPR
jgi:uroporphyrinogen-III synthase